MAGGSGTIDIKGRVVVFKWFSHRCSPVYKPADSVVARGNPKAAACALISNQTATLFNDSG